MTRIDRLELAYDLTFSTPFHAGTGLRVGLIDRTVVRDRDGYLYMPGSTIKGVLRQHCEELARLYEVLDDQMHALIASPHDTQVALWSRGHFPTMITRIFGSRDNPGCVCFDDARQAEQEKRLYENKDDSKQRRNAYKTLQTQLATQVRLDRPTRLAVPGALYTSEFGNQDIILQGTVTGWLECLTIEGFTEPGPTYSLLLLLAGLLLLERLGGNKSTGKGHCHCEIKSLKYGGVAYPKDLWQTWLDHLDSLSYYSYAIAQEGER